jgi:hypothetical protein
MFSLSKSLHLSNYLCLSMHLYICLIISVCPSICAFVCQSIHLSVILGREAEEWLFKFRPTFSIATLYSKRPSLMLFQNCKLVFLLFPGEDETLGLNYKTFLLTQFTIAPIIYSVLQWYNVLWYTDGCRRVQKSRHF